MPFKIRLSLFNQLHVSLGLCWKRWEKAHLCKKKKNRKILSKILIKCNRFSTVFKLEDNERKQKTKKIETIKLDSLLPIQPMRFARDNVCLNICGDSSKRLSKPQFSTDAHFRTECSHSAYLCVITAVNEPLCVAF